MNEMYSNNDNDMTMVLQWMKLLTKVVKILTKYEKIFNKAFKI